MADRGGRHAACKWYAGAIASTVAQAPWIDERTIAAIEALGRHLAGHRETLDAAACLARAEEVIFRAATLAHREAQRLHRRDLFEVAVVRYRRILAAVPRPSQAPLLRFSLAEALFALAGPDRDGRARYCEAALLYREAIVTNGERPWAERDEPLYASVIATRDCLDERDPSRKKALSAAYDFYLAQASASAPDRAPIRAHRERLTAGARR